MAPRMRDARAKPDAPVVVDVAPVTPGSVKSAGRVLQILEFFDEIQREARVAEIADRLSFPQSSASVLLRCLVHLGYLDYLPDTRSFLPSVRVALLGTWLDKGPIRNGSLIRMLEELAEKTGDTVVVSARNGIYSQYIHVLQARKVMRFHVPSGSRRLLVWSATGFALLARASEKEIASLCHRTNAEAARGQARVDPSRVLEYVNSVRAAGYFFSRGLVTPGAGSIAMPLPDDIDLRERPLAVSVSGMLDDLSRRETEIVKLMNDAVKRFLRA